MLSVMPAKKLWKFFKKVWMNIRSCVIIMVTKECFGYIF